MQRRRDELPLVKATSLNEVFRVLSPEPLLNPAQIEAFYRPELNTLRGKDPADRLKLRLDQVGRGFFHSFLVGQLGSGKSTEITRFLARITDRFRPLRIFVQRDLNPVTFGPHDVLLLILFKLAQEIEELNQHPSHPHGPLTPPEELLRDLLRYFGTEEKTTNEFADGELQAQANAKLGLPQLWNAFLSFAIRASGKIRVGYKQETKLVDYRFQRLSEIADLVNRFLEACNAQLYELEKREWFVVIEEFDKPNIDFGALQRTFVERASMFDQLSLHILITVPGWMFYSSNAARLPFGKNGRFILTDPPVYNRDHSPNPEGREALKAVLAARVNLSLLSEEALDLLVVASGGSLRELFGLVREAADNAILGQRSTIERNDAIRAVRLYRKDYRDRLGTSREDSESIGYEVLKQKLLSVYRDEPNARIPDEALNRLLRSRAVLDFNGDYWYGVHPLVVDILKEQGALQKDDSGGVE